MVAWVLSRILDYADEEKNVSGNDDLLHLAAANGSMDVVDMLISRSMNPNSLGQGVIV